MDTRTHTHVLNSIVYELELNRRTAPSLETDKDIVIMGYLWGVHVYDQVLTLEELRISLGDWVKANICKIVPR